MDMGITAEAPLIDVCLATRDPSAFPLLVEDLHQELGEASGKLTLLETLAFMKEPEAGLLKFLIIAVDEDTRGDLHVVDDILSQARRFGVSTLIANEDLTEVELYQLAQWGTMPHLEYPIQDGEIKQALREFTSTAPTVSEPKTPGTLVAIHGFLPNL